MNLIFSVFVSQPPLPSRCSAIATRNTYINPPFPYLRLCPFPRPWIHASLHLSLSHPRALHLFRRSLSRNKARRGFVRFLSRPAKKINFERRHGFPIPTRHTPLRLCPSSTCGQVRRTRNARKMDASYSGDVFFILKRTHGFSCFTRRSRSEKLGGTRNFITFCVALSAGLKAI